MAMSYFEGRIMRWFGLSEMVGEVITLIIGWPKGCGVNN